MYKEITKEDVLWHEEDEYVVMKDSDNWKIVLVANHFKYKFWYDVETPEGNTLGLIEEDIYEAINKLYQEKNRATPH